MITANDIKIIIAKNVKPGVILDVQQIQAIVQQNYSLQPIDWAPYTDTRKTVYP